VAALLLGALEPAAAADGKLEINQTCAQVGCFPGDGPGFPVTITEGGSYVLTGNLSVASSTESAIEVSPSVLQVDLDLNGFQIDGPATCSGSGASLSCAPSFGSVGIVGGARVRMRNGGVSDFAGGGIALTDWAQVEGLTVKGNGGLGGISVRASSLVSRCIAVLNGGDGISAGAASVVRHSIANANKGRGILGSAAGTVVMASAVSFNGHDGIGTSFGALVRGNAAHFNQQAGIAADAGSTVIDNVSHANQGIGIYAIPAGSAVNRNAVRGNVGVGISLAPTSSYRENTVSCNGACLLGGVSLGANFCFTAPCP
jgi:hypothetical protein